MNWQHVKAEWTEYKGKVKEEWGKLTDDDLLEIEGRRDQLLARIRQRYRIAVDEAERRVAVWEQKVAEIDTRAPE